MDAEGNPQPPSHYIVPRSGSRSHTFSSIMIIAPAPSAIPGMRRRRQTATVV
jgi:hypothetical protein